MASMAPASEPPTSTLTYSIAGCSEHSGKYVAENILVDAPTDQSSRWSGAYQMPNGRQWVLLKLENISVLKSITFGKYHKPHPCNMKEFKLYIGLTEDRMVEVLHSGLKNDTMPETFPIKHIHSSGIYVPTQYVKIAPLSAHGQSFHTSIWHVAMSGIGDDVFMRQVQIAYDDCREDAVVRHILKHLRQRRLLTPYSSILCRTGIRFEHPLVTKLHQQLVLEGSWSAAEETVRQASSAGLFDAYRRLCQPQAVWTRLHGTDEDGDIPSPRGGHAMCIDVDHGLIYLFGGWNGRHSLDDFWVYDIAAEKWRVLCSATNEVKNGPGPRSCHKMVFDRKTGCIYLLGRLTDEDTLRGNPGQSMGPDSVTGVDGRTNGATPTNPEMTGDAAPTTPFCSEFYRYHTEGLDAGTWDLLSFDTASSGGPALIFDHQMVMDSDSQMIYVFGGRIVDGDWISCKYAGLYSYNIRTSKWKMLQSPDYGTSSSGCYIPPRFGHSMVLSSPTSTLYIFAGQRDGKYLSDMYAYDLRKNTAREVCANFSGAAIGGPEACFTQRAVIDPILREIYVFCGLRSSGSGSTTHLRSDAPNWVYRYDSGPGKWTQMLPNQAEVDDAAEAEEPQPRYAHQVVYDPRTKTVYMHGGNAGTTARPQLHRTSSQAENADGEIDREEEDSDGKDDEAGRRLDDFWSMRLKRPAVEEVVRSAIYHIRRQQFREMCEEVAPIQALHFLQTEVSAVVDHGDTEETKIFRSLLTHLLAPSPADQSSKDSSDTESTWTSVVYEDAIMADIHSHLAPPGRTRSVEEEDPVEARVRGEKHSLSADRYQQRTDLFEALLNFVEQDQREPAGNLLDMVDSGLLV